MICKHCESFFHWIQGPGRIRKSHDDRYFHYKSFAEWKRAVAGGCALCVFLRPYFNYAISTLVDQRLRPILAWLPSEDGKDDYILANVATEDEPLWGREAAGFRVVPVQPDQDRKDFIESESTEAVDSLAWLKLAKHWLRACLNEHTTCDRPRVGNNWKPTRLIQIHGKGDIRLVERDNMPSPVTYATLSHCWGTIEDKLVLTLENIERWKQAVPSFGNLETFRDAVEIAQRLGLSYIWIDSLCIMQDSREDWQLESSRMGDVYKYSYCNISATAASDDTQGCFPLRDASGELILRSTRPEALRIEFVTTSDSAHLSNSDSKIRIPTWAESTKALRGSYDFVEENIFGGWSRDVTYGSVNKRAWVFQERLLAPRILHFSRTQLYWECSELQASDTFPFGLTEHPDHKDSNFKAQSPFNVHIPTLDNQGASRQAQSAEALQGEFRLWGEIVHAFSDAKLTYKTDKLVAISSVAREMKPLMKCRYLAGHWEADLVRQLPWYGRNSRDHNRSGPYRAPSWSWASVDDSIDHFLEMYEADAYQPLLDVLKAHIELASEDEMGQVKGGHLRVRGQLIEMYRDYNDIFINGKKSDTYLHIDGGTNIPLMWVPGTFYCLPVSVSFRTSTRSERLDVLVLNKADETENFCRIGCIQHTPGWDGEDPLLQSIGKVLRDSSGAPVGIQQDSSKLREVKII